MSARSLISRPLCLSPHVPDSRESEGGREGHVGCTVVRIEQHIAFIYKKAKYSGEFNATHSASLLARFIGGGKTPAWRVPFHEKQRDKTFSLLLCAHRRHTFRNYFSQYHPRVVGSCT